MKLEHAETTTGSILHINPKYIVTIEVAKATLFGQPPFDDTLISKATFVNGQQQYFKGELARLKEEYEPIQEESINKTLLENNHKLEIQIQRIKAAIINTKQSAKDTLTEIANVLYTTKITKKPTPEKENLIPPIIRIREILGNEITLETIARAAETYLVSITTLAIWAEQEVLTYRNGKLIKRPQPERLEEF